MAYGKAICASCGSREGVEEHHLYLKSEGCPDTLTIWLCHVCHGMTHGMKRRVNIRSATKNALQALKASGAKLGNRTNLQVAAAMGAKAGAEAADAFAVSVMPIVREIQSEGAVTMRAIAAALNARGVRTARGGEWHPMTVANLLAR